MTGCTLDVWKMKETENFWRQVANTWVVERHPKGGLGCCTLMDCLERNYRRWREKKTEAGWEILAVLPDPERAQARIRELKHEMAGILEGGQ